jgi:predicted nucleotidyltransferase
LEDSFTENLLKVCHTLNKNGVEYLIVGGTAVAFHGHFRMTTLSNNLLSEKHDFDFWYNPSYENYFKLLNALEELGLNVSELIDEQAPNPKKSFFTHEFEKFKVDFLPQVLGLQKFSISFSRKITSVVDDVRVYILSFKDLMDSKEAASRTKDKDDLNNLRSRSSDEQV